MPATASSIMATRSSTPNRGCFPGFSSTATSTSPKEREARRMISRWPLVTGSNVPGQRATSPICDEPPLWLLGDLEHQQGRVPVGKSPFELEVYWNHRVVTPARTGQDDPATGLDDALTSDF